MKKVSSKKILLIIPEMCIGGAQRSLAKLSKELVQHHQVYLVTFNASDEIAYPYGGTFLHLNVTPHSNIFSKLKSFIQRVNRLRKIKQQLGIDVSISFLEGADYVNILSKKKDRVVISIRGSKRFDEKIDEHFSFIRNKFLIPQLYKRADAIVTVNHGIARELQLYYGLPESNIETIGNFYDANEILKQSSVARTGSLDKIYSDPVLISTGRLASEKGLEQLLEVFAMLRKRITNVRFIMVGNGPLYETLIAMCELRKLIVSKGVDFEMTPDVVMIGADNNVYQYLRGATVYLMNSSSEGFPNGLAESMICSVPVVSADCPYGPREILAPEFPFVQSVSKPYASPCGMLMPMMHSLADRQQWVNTLEDLLNDENKRNEFAVNALKRISEFDRNAVNEKWEAVIHKVLS